MIYVVLLSNTSNDIYLDNKISSFKVKLSDIAGGPRALGSSTERNSVKKEKNYFIGWNNTIIERPSN